MKHLLLLRHAKAMPGGGGIADRDRPLAERGKRDAGLMGVAIGRDYPPYAILCSSSLRTRETLATLLPHMSGEPTVKITDGLYEPPTGKYGLAIAAHGGDSDRLLVIGHNPAIQATALALSATGDKKLRQQLAAKMPTCALAVIAFETDDWSDIESKSGRLVAFLRPRDLGAVDADD